MSEDQNETIATKLRELRECAEEACRAARNDPFYKTEPVNWADFGCVAAECFVTDDGQAGLRIWLEEADPGAIHVHACVRDYLAKHGWTGVHVVTQW